MSSLKERSVALHATAAEAGFAAMVSNAARALVHRFRANGLRELDDRLLDDIGLCRSDLEKALSEGNAFTDPTPALTRAVRARSWRRLSGRSL